jgi:hypothetical protein
MVDDPAEGYDRYVKTDRRIVSRRLRVGCLYRKTGIGSANAVGHVMGIGSKCGWRLKWRAGQGPRRAAPAGRVCRLALGRDPAMAVGGRV